MGCYGITIGTESGDDTVLKRMNKGYDAADIVAQCRKLEAAGIRYNISYLSGLSGSGGGQQNAERSAAIFNQLHPYIINVVSLTLFPESRLYTEMQQGLFTEASEQERLQELYTLIERLNIRTTILANTVSNVVPLTGILPNDKATMLRCLDEAMSMLNEKEMKDYRKGITSL